MRFLVVLIVVFLSLLHEKWMPTQHLGVFFGRHLDILQKGAFLCVPRDLHNGDGRNAGFIGICCERTASRMRPYSIVYTNDVYCIVLGG